jgi:hypothetical protein
MTDPGISNAKKYRLNSREGERTTVTPQSERCGWM